MKKVKAWGIIVVGNNRLCQWVDDKSHSTDQYNVYVNEQRAKSELLRRTVAPKDFKVVPVDITYSLPRKRRGGK